MTQPEYVPVAVADKVRQLERLPAPRRWKAERPGETDGGHPSGRRFGTPGPDQGYALRLAHILEPKLVVGSGEHREDAVHGCLGVALRRAALFGRAPVIHDLALAFTVWGFLGDAPPDLLAFRKPLFLACEHDDLRQREIADRVPAATLGLTPADVRTRLSSWRELVDAG